MRILLKILSVVAMGIASIWLYFDHSFEPVLTTVVSISALISTFYFDGPQNNAKQSQNVENAGTGIQAGGDVIINMGGSDSTTDTANLEEVRSKKSYDLRVVEELLDLIPYEDTLHHVDLSYLHGMPYEFARKLDRAENFNNVRYQLYNPKVEAAKSKFVASISKFNSVAAEFLGVDDATKEPLMVVPPYHWKNNGSEATYRDLQGRLGDAAVSVTEQYDNFIRTLKSEGFVSDKI